MGFALLDIFQNIALFGALLLFCRRKVLDVFALGLARDGHALPGDNPHLAERCLKYQGAARGRGPQGRHLALGPVGTAVGRQGVDRGLRDGDVVDKIQWIVGEKPRSEDDPAAEASARAQGGWTPEAEAKLAALARKTGRKPNIFIFLMDDTGYMDPGFNGGGVAVGNATPNMDKFAYEGLVLSSAYTTPSCSPTPRDSRSARPPS